MKHLSDPERELALAYAPARARAALGVLWRLDERLGEALAATYEPTLRAIRLAWWRDALAAFDSGSEARDPLLQAVSAHLLPAGLTGAELAGLSEGWAAIVDEPPDREALARHARLRGEPLFAFSARLLGGDNSADGAAIAAAGAGWVLGERLRYLPPSARPEALSLARDHLTAAPIRWPRPLRALGILTALARRDAARDASEPKGSPARVFRALALGISGR